MTRLLTILLLAALLLTACANPNPPIDDATTTASTGEDSTTPADNEPTTPEDTEATTPEDTETTTPEDSETTTPSTDENVVEPDTDRRIQSCRYVYPKNSQTVTLTDEDIADIVSLWENGAWSLLTSEVSPFFAFQTSDGKIGYNDVMGIFIDTEEGKQLTLSSADADRISQILHGGIVLPSVTVQTVECCTYLPSDIELELSNEDVAQIVAILNADGWERDVTKTAYFYVLEASGNEIRYANSESRAILNDWSNMRHLVLSEEQTDLINSIFEKYVN